MRVNIYQTVEVSDEQRREIALALHGKATRRGATRDDIKDYVWQHGARWEQVLAWGVQAAETDTEADEDLLGTLPDDGEEEDLLGTTVEPDDEDLLGTAADDDDEVDGEDLL